MADICDCCGEEMDLGPNAEAFDQTGIICCDDCAPEVLMTFDDNNNQGEAA